MKVPSVNDLQQAWQFRESRGWVGPGLDREEALRLFYGPGEGSRQSPWENWAVDAYGSWLWMTEWEGRGDLLPTEVVRKQSERTYSARGFRGAVALRRPARGIPEKPELLWGEPPPEKFEVTERLGKLPEHAIRVQIRLLEGRHPGLFLDHRPLRNWLASSCECRGKRVLNTFAYTGSLGLAARAGGATSVTTLDLSKATLRWAEENFQLNGFAGDQARFIGGDFFEELPRLRRRGGRFDVVIADPPSFSRGKKANFSTQKDLVKLHEELFSVLEPGGLLVSSINSSNVSWPRYEAEIRGAAENRGVKRLELVRRIEQPETFPARAGDPRSAYLKGFVFRVG